VAKKIGQTSLVADKGMAVSIRQDYKINKMGEDKGIVEWWVGER